MKLIAKTIREARKIKGLTQEELAEKSSINLRTVQRIENSESEPRGKTLNLICEVLEIDRSSLEVSSLSHQESSLANRIVNGLFLLALNLILMGVIGYLTLDSNANLNSRVGGSLLSFFIPFFIVVLTRDMKRMERLLKFGFGYLLYFVLVMIVNGFVVGFVTGLFPCLLLSLTVLYYGNEILKSNDWKQ